VAVAVGVMVGRVKGGRGMGGVCHTLAIAGQLRKLGELSRSGTAMLGTAAVNGSLAGHASGQGLDARCARFAGNLRTWPAMPREKAQATEPRCALYCRRRPSHWGRPENKLRAPGGNWCPVSFFFSASTVPGLLGRPDARYRAAPPQQGGIKTAKLRAPGIPPGARFFGSRA
jgi:hypothetical protein